MKTLRWKHEYRPHQQTNNLPLQGHWGERDAAVWFSVALRPQRRVGLLGTGTEWEGDESDRLDRGNRPKKTGETVDRRQNNGSVKAVSPRHCPATCALRNCSFNCCAGQSHKDNVRCTAVMNNLDNSKQNTSNLLSPASPPYSWSLLGKSEGPAPPPSSKISWSFDLAWNPKVTDRLVSS